jgi:release factor glutamine methyltransferase
MDEVTVYPIETDTILLLDAAQEEVEAGDRVLEVGTGSGFIAQRIGEYATVVATDCNPHATRIAHAGGVEVICTDLCAGLRGPFDLILFNPPYLPTSPEERLPDPLELALDGGPDGRTVIARFAAAVSDVLALNGRILLLVSSHTGPAEVAAIFAARGFDAAVVRQIHVFDEDLYVLKMMKTQGSGCEYRADNHGLHLNYNTSCDIPT